MIADAIEANLEMLAVAESWENGKPVRVRRARGLALDLVPSRRELRGR